MWEVREVWEVWEVRQGPATQLEGWGRGKLQGRGQVPRLAAGIFCQ